MSTGLRRESEQSEQASRMGWGGVGGKVERCTDGKTCGIMGKKKPSQVSIEKQVNRHLLASSPVHSQERGCCDMYAQRYRNIERCFFRGNYISQHAPVKQFIGP